LLEGKTEADTKLTCARVMPIEVAVALTIATSHSSEKSKVSALLV
jgi:hypothetical protein